MQVQRHYSRAPITEAIIDFRITPPEGLSINKIAEIYPHIKDNFPTIEPFYKSVSAITFQPGSSSSSIEEEQIGFWFRSEDNLQTFQATLEGFTFNRLAPYTSWLEFSNDAKHFWKIYREICEPTYVKRIAIRYINQINIPAKELIELKDYLRTVPEISVNLPQNTLQSFFMQLQIPQQDLNCMLIINEAIAPPTNPEVVTIILDLDLFNQQTWESNDENIWDFLEKLRQRKNEVFNESITSKTKELIS